MVCFSSCELGEAVGVVYTQYLYSEYTELFYLGIECLRARGTPPPKGQRLRSVTAPSVSVFDWHMKIFPARGA